MPAPRLFPLVSLISVCVLVLVVVGPRLGYRRTSVHTCFHSAVGLKPGAGVRAAGATVGVVRTVTAGERDCGIDVGMTLRTPSKSQIPADAVAEQVSDGRGGPVSLEIDTNRTSAAPIRENALLKSREGEITGSGGAVR
jgi:ABC-type transporter Mla subunit MlaD